MKILKKIVNIIFSIIMFFIVVLLINGLINKGIYITNYNLDFERMPEELNGYKILQITDVHSIRNEKEKENYLKKIKDSNPNIIVITGDLIDASYYNAQNEMYIKEEIKMPDELTVEFCRELTKISKVYYVYGNHEMMLLDNPEENVFKTKLEEDGVIILNNKVEYIDLGTSSYRLVGIQDPATLYKDKKYAFIGESNKEKADSILHDLFLEEAEDVFTVCLSHRPEYFEIYGKYDIDLVLTGHAHGGIVRIPFVGGLYAHPQGWFPKYSEGLHKDGDRLNMIIGRGIGNSTIDFRLLNPPELVLITLAKKV